MASSDSRRADQRNHLAFVSAVNAKILVGCDHAVMRIKLAHPDQTKIGQIGLPVGVALGQGDVPTSTVVVLLEAAVPPTVTGFATRELSLLPSILCSGSAVSAEFVELPNRPHKPPSHPQGLGFRSGRTCYIVVCPSASMWPIWGWISVSQSRQYGAGSPSWPP